MLKLFNDIIKFYGDGCDSDFTFKFNTVKKNYAKDDDNIIYYGNKLQNVKI